MCVCVCKWQPLWLTYRISGTLLSLIQNRIFAFFLVLLLLQQFQTEIGSSYFTAISIWPYCQASVHSASAAFPPPRPLFHCSLHFLCSLHAIEMHFYLRSLTLMLDFGFLLGYSHMLWVHFNLLLFFSFFFNLPMQLNNKQIKVNFNNQNFCRMSLDSCCFLQVIKNGKNWNRAEQRLLMLHAGLSSFRSSCCCCC